MARCRGFNGTERSVFFTRFSPAMDGAGMDLRDVVLRLRGLGIVFLSSVSPQDNLLGIADETLIKCAREDRAMKRLARSSVGTAAAIVLCAVSGCGSTSTCTEASRNGAAMQVQTYFLSADEIRPSPANVAVLNKDAEIKRLIKLARAATIAGRYEDAIALLDPILQLDPQNDYATGVRPLLEDKVVKLEQRRWDEH